MIIFFTNSFNKESRIISLDNITLDGENFWKDVFLNSKKRPLRNCDVWIYVLFDEWLKSEDEELQEYSKEELDTSDRIGRIHAKTNRDGWLYVKGLPYDTCFIFCVNDGKK